MRPPKSATLVSNGDRVLARLERQDAVAASTVREIATTFGIPVAELLHRDRRQQQVVLARQVLMYLLNVTHQRNMRRIGALLGRDRTTVAHACAAIEDKRDEPDFDALVDTIEKRLTATTDNVAKIDHAAA
jgi:chromosomal replication initiation ATPase DnaA